jgi:uncharacterized protein YhhL (DUF1145 family)
MHPGKIVLLIIWAYGLASFVIAPESTFAGVGRLIFLGMAAIHVVECGVFWKALQRAGGSMPSQLARTFLFGVLHLQEIGAVGKPSDPGA